MRYPLYIARRYLFSRSSNNAINIITLIAAIGVVVGAMSLFIVLSAFSGLKSFSLQFTNVFDSDLEVRPSSGKTFSLKEGVEEELAALPGVVEYSKVIEERIFMQYKGRNHIAYIKGVDDRFSEVIPVDSILFLSNWFEPGMNEVVVGTGTALKLTMGVNDYANLLEIYVPTPGTGQITEMNITEAFRRERVVVSGLYEVNEDVNSKYVFTDFELARSLLSMDSSEVSSIEMKLGQDADEESTRSELQKIFTGQDITIKNRIQQNDALYKMLNTENIAVYLIFTLVLIIALFNVIGSIIMMILDKRKDINTLYNLGATMSEIRSVFYLQGTLMTTLGGLAGIFLGAIIVWAQLKFKFIYITATLPYPVEFRIVNILIVFATITVLGMLASRIAAGRVREGLVR